MKYLLLLAGFLILIYSGKYLVKSSVAIANRFNIPKIIIGITIVALGTSAPELLVSVSASLKGHPDVAIYNIIGSNISNIAFVLAVASIVYPVTVKRFTLRFDWPVMFGISLLLYGFLLNNELDGVEGLVLLAFIVLVVLMYIYFGKKGKIRMEVKDESKQMNFLPAFLLIILSSAGLALGADLLVDNAIIIATDFWMSERVISISLIALGTSIPELTTSVIAALNKESDISIGNIIGSNLFNIGFVLGIVALIRPIPVNPLAVQFDLYVMLGIALLLVIMLIIPKKMVLSRWKGLIIFCTYLAYLYLIIERIN
jgi:cation:H+ antiporter